MSVLCEPPPVFVSMLVSKPNPLTVIPVANLPWNTPVSVSSCVFVLVVSVVCVIVTVAPPSNDKLSVRHESLFS